MQAKDFKSIVMTFADPGTPLVFDNTHLCVSINGDLISAQISSTTGDIFIEDGAGRLPAAQWIVGRLARLDLLAQRLIETVPDNRHFVSPAAALYSMNSESDNEEGIASTDALVTVLDEMGKKSSLETHILYITSEAGEGKTSVINEAARRQADNYIHHKTDWLIVPIPLGGRHFLRFDDITVGALQNRYRFPFLYYASFLALVKMGVIVPAFDGFEEMFVENSTGEALSAMGILVESLDSQGAVLIAARKAYFEFENLRIKERLFDTIRTHSASFGKLELMRWTENQFTNYCRRRGVHDSARLYMSVTQRLRDTHPLLTRAVLVKRLIDIALEATDLDCLLQRLKQSEADFFFYFVQSIVEREANEKWVDRSGENEIGSPLLSPSEHMELLSEIALEAWKSHTDYMTRENLELVCDYYCSLHGKSASQVYQIRRRIGGHALLTLSQSAANALEFDHDEFRNFFLGEAICREMENSGRSKDAVLMQIFRRGVLPRTAQRSLINALARHGAIRREDIIHTLLTVSKSESQASCTHQNCSSIIMRLIGDSSVSDLSIDKLAFENDALRDRKLNKISFHNCYFAPTSLENMHLLECEFRGCRFAQVRLYKSSLFERTVFDQCVVENVTDAEKSLETYDPLEISSLLGKCGVIWSEGVEIGADDSHSIEWDPELIDLTKLLRAFLRNTSMPDSLIHAKLGVGYPGFMSRTLPELLEKGVLEEVPHRGGGVQKRYRLSMSSESVNQALARSKGSYAQFVVEIRGLRGSS